MKLIDPHALSGLNDDEKDELLTLYISEMQSNYLPCLQISILDKNWNSIRLIAHDIQSTSLNMGCRKIAALANKIRTSDSDWKLISKYYSKIDRLLHKLIDIVNRSR